MPTNKGKLNERTQTFTRFWQSGLTTNKLYCSNSKSTSRTLRSGEMKEEYLSSNAIQIQVAIT
jgi:hypothetical protein